MFLKKLFVSVVVFEWIHICLTDPTVFLNRPSTPYGGELVASARSWSPVIFNKEPVASSRSWSPRSDVSFPQRRPYTNAGQLNYQRQDAAKYLRSTAKPKKLLFPDPVQASSGSIADSGFRPSPEIAAQPATHRSEIITAADATATSAALTQSFNADTVPSSKTARFVTGDIVIAPAPTVEVSPTATSPSEFTELVDAMEQLVERINELEVRISESERDEREAETTKTLVTINDSLTATKIKLESDISRLSERAQTLEQRLSALEEFTREWVDPNILAQDNIGKANGKRDIGRACPTKFFPIDHSDPNSPCYYISPIPNFRKNWQDASSSCQDMGAKLAEPSSPAALRKLTDYLVHNRTDQLGGGYWTGGINPGLTWLWPSSSRSLNEIDPDMWISGSIPSPNDAGSGKCLRLSFDRNGHRYALQGSDCQRYLYFICEYDFKSAIPGSDRNGLEKSLEHLHSVVNSVALPDETQQVITETASHRPQPSVTSTENSATPEIAATTWRPDTTSTLRPKTSGTPVPIRRFSRPTGRPLVRTTSTAPFSFRTTTVQPATTRKTTTQSPPTPNYIGVIGFKGVNVDTQTEKPPNLAILTDSLL